MKTKFWLAACLTAAVWTASACEEDRRATLQEIRLTPLEITLTKGETAVIQAQPVPEEAVLTEVTWTSSAPLTVSVADDGTVTGLEIGEALITAESQGIKGNCKVVVKSPDLESIAVRPESLSLFEGEEITLEYEYLPADADFGNAVWSSSDESIAKVDNQGKVTAVQAGTADITLSCSGIEGVCHVSVSAPAALGDYFYEDGTYSAELDPEKQAIGLVVFVNPDGKGGKIISLDEIQSVWGPDGVLAGTSDELDGKVNMETIRGLESWEENYPAARWCDEKQEGDLEWYLPAKKELRQLYAGISGKQWRESGAIAADNEINDWGDFMGNLSEANYVEARKAFNERLAAVDGAVQLDLDTRMYWSSTESDEDLIWCIPLRNGGVSFDTKNYDRIRVRAMASF